MHQFLVQWHQIQLTMLKSIFHETEPSRKRMYKIRKSLVFTSWVSLLLVTGLLSLSSIMMWRKRLLGTSLTITHLTGKCPDHLSCCQYSTLVSKSTGPTISATPQNCALAFTWKSNIFSPSVQSSRSKLNKLNQRYTAKAWEVLKLIGTLPRTKERLGMPLL